MSMIEIKHRKDECNRDVVTYIDTDELSDEEYYEYRKLRNEDKFAEARKFIKKIRGLS